MMKSESGRRFRALGVTVTLAACGLTASMPEIRSVLFHSEDAKEIVEVRPKAGSPNILVWVMDDVGFGQLGAFGGAVETPNLDRLAAAGLLFTNYHTTPICSASRASLLTGRNSHAVHIGGHSAMAVGFSGYDARVPRGAGTIAANLGSAGYATFAIGKWDHLPPEHSSQSGPYTYWPSGQGFDRFYGFLTYDADNFSPVLWSDHTPVELPGDPDFHLSADMADKAIDWIASRDADPARRPFFLYWATGAAHSPHHAPEADRMAYRGRFDAGWDVARSEILERQKELGIVPVNTRLPPRPEGMPAWDSLSANEQRLYARAMEAFAAQLTHADRQFGRMIDALDARGELDNTLIIVVSDNGASAEGAPGGIFSEFMMANGRYPGVEENLNHYEGWGGPDTYPLYPVGWAVAGNTPFRFYKQTAYEGAIRVPMIVSWPDGIASGEAPRDQYLHAIDLAATIYDAADLALPETINGVPQLQLDGESLLPLLRAPDSAEGGRRLQYYEMYGNRAIYADGWKAVVPHRLETWDFSKPASFSDDTWELYDLRKDPNELNDLAMEFPDKLRELRRQFDAEARKNNVYPLTNTGDAQRWRAALAEADMASRGYTWQYTGRVVRIPEALAPPIHTHSFKADFSGEFPLAAEGTLMAIGGRNGGLSWFVQDGVPGFVFHNIDHSRTVLLAVSAIPEGPHDVSLAFWRTADGADVELFVDDREVAAGTVPGPLPVYMFTSNETFDAGDDTGTTVSPLDAGETAFNGQRATLRVTVQPLAPEQGSGR